MKTKLLYIFVSLFVFASCSKNNDSKFLQFAPPIAEGETVYTVLSTQKSIGGELKLLIRADEANQADVWVDLNANGKRDSNETVGLFGKDQTYHILSQSIVLYGKFYELQCPNNKIRSLDLSNNKYLRVLYCSGNLLSELNLENNKNLTTLYCLGNQLSVLDLRNNPALVQLFCAGNRLRTLDLTANITLEALYCQNNELTELIILNNSNLKNVEIYGNRIAELGHMQAIVDALPSRELGEKAAFTILNARGSTENRITREQMLVVKEKNWLILDSNREDCVVE